MSPLTYANAKAANGAKVVEWLDHKLGGIPHHDKHDYMPRMLNEWRRGTQPMFVTVDRVLCRYGFHPSELPDDVWEEPRPRTKDCGLVREGKALKLTSADVRRIRESGLPTRVLAGELGVSISTVRKTRNGTIHRDVGVAA